MRLFRALMPFVLTIPVAASAQFIASNNNTSGPNPGIEAVRPGAQQWVKEEDLVNGRINNTRLEKMKGAAAGIVDLFRNTLSPEEQYAAIWHGEYYSEKTSPGPQMKFAAICNFLDQKASLQVVANDISPLMDHIVLNNQDFLTIRPANAINRDCPYFEYTDNNNNINKAWLIAGSNDPLPYTPVSRKEYLTEALNELTGLKKSITQDLQQQMPVRSQAVQDAEKKAIIDQLSGMYSGADLQGHIKAYFAKYKTDEEYLKSRADKATAELDSTMHFMQTMLKDLSAGELAGPAIVSVQAADFRGFENSHSGRMLIRMNPAFFNAYPGGEKARFFLVTLSYDGADAQAASLDRLVNEKMDVQALREMIGK